MELSRRAFLAGLALTGCSECKERGSMQSVPVPDKPLPSRFGPKALSLKEAYSPFVCALPWRALDAFANRDSEADHLNSAPAAG